MADEKRRLGRPPLDADDPSVGITVSIPSKVLDVLRERARRAQVSIPEIIRRRLRAAATERL